MRLSNRLPFFCIIAVFSCFSFLAAEEVGGEFQSYWYQGAEISTFDLKQYRYGQIHAGNAVLIYVTENFLEDKQVKHEFGPKERAVPILKLNATRNFFTGVYPYSLMTSVFHPIQNVSSPLKITSSSQEWCGNTFTQWNQGPVGWKMNLFSYFQKEGDMNLDLEEGYHEDGLWTLLRIDPKKLPVGEFFLYLSCVEQRFRHSQIQAHKVIGTFDGNITYDGGRKGESFAKYQIAYQDLGRELEIIFEQKFPYRVLEWREIYKDVSGKTVGETIAVRKTWKLLDYWNRNKSEDRKLREELQLPLK
jgi:hypothetical protein